MEEAAVKNLEDLFPAEIYDDLALLPRKSADINNCINECRHEDSVSLPSEGMADWTQFNHWN
ncbi:MAG: hypothetical protein HPY50_00090 [Firmicutes bacterium]|nr:hypothetical protein [Bacillota bacterium]